MSVRRDGNRFKDGQGSGVDLTGYLDLERGLISRNLFIDDDIYRQELEQIFARCWLYLGHESQLPNPHDYFTNSMGEDPVLVTRGGDGKIRAFHNSCRHRGMTVCRTDGGNAERFRCPYHSWTYDSSGKLVSVPRLGTAYGGELDAENWGLFEVAQVDTYVGLIFATWDPQTPPLLEYLGDMAFYLDLMLNRHPGGSEVIGGVQKMTVPANWKFAAENNLAELYHVPSVHGSNIEIGFREPMGTKGYSIHLKNGHGLGAEFGGANRGSAVHTGYTEYLAESRQQVADKYGDVANRIVPVGTAGVFPSLAVFDSARFRVIDWVHPKGPDTCEIHTCCVVDRALPDDLKEETFKQVALAGGMFRVDDEEVWKECQRSGIQGVVGRKLTFNYQMGIGHDRPAAELFAGSEFPGEMGELFPDEGNQRNFYQRWLELMNAPSGTSDLTSSGSAGTKEKRR